MLKGRLGLDSAKVPHADRAGLLYLARGALVRDGTLAFLQGRRHDGGRAGGAGVVHPSAGGSRMILLGPGSTVSHDALRLLASHARTALAAVGEDGVRLYTAPPLIPESLRARQAPSAALGRRERHADNDRPADVCPSPRGGSASSDLAVLRGIEGARMKETYRSRPSPPELMARPPLRSRQADRGGPA